MTSITKRDCAAVNALAQRVKNGTQAMVEWSAYEEAAASSIRHDEIWNAADGALNAARHLVNKLERLTGRRAGDDQLADLNAEAAVNGPPFFEGLVR